MTNNKQNGRSVTRVRNAVSQNAASLIFWLGDMLSVALAAYLSYFARFSDFTMPSTYRLLMVVGCLVGFFVFATAGFRGSLNYSLSFDHTLRVLRSAATLAFVLIIFLFLTKTSADYSRIWLVSWFILIPILMLALRLFALAMIRRLPLAMGSEPPRVTLVGRGVSCSRVLAALEEEQSEVEVKSVWLTDDSEFEMDSGHALTAQRFSEVVGEEAPGSEIWVCMPLSDGGTLDEVLRQLAGYVANIRLIPDMSDFLLVNYSVTDVCGMPAFSLTSSPMQGVAPLIKALEDRCLALLFLILSSPVMLLVSIGVKMSSPGPIFYKQPRVGWNGKLFNILKFRSMPVDLEAGQVQWGNADRKVTGRFSKFIRNTSLDELPQFINVLRGEMSLVGPRPERPEFVDQFKNDIPGYMQKHLVKAGITGWAQLHGWRGDTDLKKRIEFDLYYIENWSLWLDLRIIFQTVIAIAVRKL